MWRPSLNPNRYCNYLINNLVEIKMNIYTNILLGVAAIIGLIGLSATPAFADSIHGVLENNRIANETVETKTIAGKREPTLWTIQDYVKNYRAAFEANDAVEFEVSARMSEPTTGGWQKALGEPGKAIS